MRPTKSGNWIYHLQMCNIEVLQQFAQAGVKIRDNSQLNCMQYANGKETLKGNVWG